MPRTLARTQNPTLSRRGGSDLPAGPSDQERALYAAFDALESKLSTLPEIPWRSVTITRTREGFRCQVVI